MATQRWSADKNIQFIHQYRRNPCLWDPQHYQYKNKYARELAYKSIVQAMGMATIQEVINKIRILRNTHNNQILKTKKSSTTSQPYISKIAWLSHLDFIKNVEGHAKTVENLQKEDKDEINLDEPSVEFVELTNPEELFENTDVNDAEDIEVTRKRSRSMYFNNDIYNDDNSSGCTYSHTEAQIQYTQPREDCFDTFGKYVSAMLRMMPRQKAMEMQPKIVILLTSVNFDSVDEQVSQSDENIF